MAKSENAPAPVTPTIFPRNSSTVFSLLAAEQRVVRIVGLRGDDVDVQAFGPAPNRRLGAANAGEVNIAGDQSCQGGRPAADKDRFHRKALISKEPFGYGDAKRELIVPGKADKDYAQRLFFLGGGRTAD